MKPTLLWEGEDISVFSFPLSAEPETFLNYAFVLSSHEQAQVDTFRSTDQRTKAIVRRGALRQLLGDRLGREPSEIEFQVAQFGKPSVKDHPVQFSASSSGDIGIVAISEQRVVGVDVERHDLLMIKDTFDFYSTFEHQLVQTAEDKADVFFRIWTRKESCVKATGHGIGRYALDQLEVMPDLSSSATVKFFDMSVMVHDIEAPEGYSMAVAWDVS